MLPTTISLLIVLTIVALVAWGIKLLRLPRWLAGFGYVATAAGAGVLIANFALTITGHPWFVYGGLAAP